MKNQFPKILFFVFLFVLVLFGIVWQEQIRVADAPAIIPADSIISSNATTDLLRVYFLNVGQGDAEYIRTPAGLNILIDGGPDNSILSELGKTMPFYDRQIDIMILTHPHADHVAGLVEVLRRFQVKQVYYTGVLQTTPDYLSWLAEIEKQKIPLFIIKEKTRVNLGEGLALEFLFPRHDLINQRIGNLNNASIVNQLIFHKVKFLFMGDLEEEGEKELLVDGDDLSVDVLKIGHHGSNTASSQLFLNQIKPKIAVIEVGAGNKFGHPHLVTLKKLARMGVTICQTDQNGTIEMESNGINIDIK